MKTMSMMPPRMPPTQTLPQPSEEESGGRERNGSGVPQESGNGAESDDGGEGQTHCVFHWSCVKPLMWHEYMHFDQEEMDQA